MRDVQCDRYSKMAEAQIIVAEERDLQKSVKHASEVCSVVAAFRLMDVIYKLDYPGSALSAPSHARLPVNFANFKVPRFPTCLYSLFNIYIYF